MDDNRLTKRIFQWSEGLAGNNWVNSVKKFLQRNDLPDITNLNSRDAIKVCSPVLEATEKENWRSNLWNDKGLANGNKLRTYRSFKKAFLRNPT